MTWLFDRVHEAFHRPESPLYRRVDTVVWAAIFVSITFFLQELAWGREGPAGALLDRADLALLVLFGIEVTLRIASHRPPEVDFYDSRIGRRLREEVWGRVRFALSPLILIDILTVVAVVPELRGLRALRLLRLVRGRRFFRYGNPFDGLIRAFDENALLLGFGFSVFGTLALLGGVSVTLVEVGHNEGIRHLGDGMWWAIVTLTTVGFGDITPVTPVGKVVGAVLMVGGMITLALFAGIVGQTLMTGVLTIRQEQFRMRSTVNHIVVCGFEVGNQMVIDALRTELDLDKQQIVVFSPGERPVDLPPEFVFVPGDPTKESELEKARVRYAQAIVLLGSRKVDPQHADAATILTAFTIRRFQRNRPLDRPRARPLYIVAEILDTENVEHARTAGADEVIETTRIGFSLVAHAIRYHGTASLLGHLAQSAGDNVYVGALPADLALPVSWRELSTRLKDEYDVLLIGLRDGATGKDRLNPSRDQSVVSGDQLVYVASSEVLPPVDPVL